MPGFMGFRRAERDGYLTDMFSLDTTESLAAALVLMLGGTVLSGLFLPLERYASRALAHRATGWCGVVLVAATPVVWLCTGTLAVTAEQIRQPLHPRSEVRTGLGEVAVDVGAGEPSELRRGEGVLCSGLETDPEADIAIPGVPEHPNEHTVRCGVHDAAIALDERPEPAVAQEREGLHHLGGELLTDTLGSPWIAHLQARLPRRHPQPRRGVVEPAC